MKMAGFLQDVITDPAVAFSQEPNEAAFQRAFGTNLTTFEWMELPENAMIHKKFGIAMAGTTDYSNDKIVSRGQSFTLTYYIYLF